MKRYAPIIIEKFPVLIQQGVVVVDPLPENPYAPSHIQFEKPFADTPTMIVGITGFAHFGESPKFELNYGALGGNGWWWTFDSVNEAATSFRSIQFSWIAIGQGV